MRFLQRSTQNPIVGSRKAGTPARGGGTGLAEVLSGKVGPQERRLTGQRFEEGGARA